MFKTGRKRILALLCEVFSPAEIRAMCRSAGMEERDIEFVEQRFIKGWSRERCDMPESEQRRKINRIETWLVTEAVKRKPDMPAYQLESLEQRLESF